jgi:O-antigen/teichoic acid export membrane protein
MTTLSHKTTTGVFWNLLQQFASRGITVLVTLVLAYFLTPEDFGLVAMMTVFLAIANSLMDSGFRQALIRMKEAKPIDYNTGFFANLVLGLLAYVLLFVSAPLIAGFYEQPQLIDLLRIASLTVITNAFQVVQVARLSREMNFKAQFKATLPASALSALVALAMAYFGYGVWALVGQMLASAFFVALFLALQLRWFPGREVSLTSLRSMYNFGYKLFLSGVLDTVFQNIYVIVIAKLFSASLAGLYFFADRIRQIVVYQLVSSIQNVTFPALSTLQDDEARLKSGFRSVIAVTTFIMFPVTVFLAALADPLLQLLLPEKWWPAASYLQLMCLAGLLVPLHAINLNILKVKGRSDLFLLLEVIKKTMLVLILFVSYRFGIIGILLGQIVSSLLAYLPNSYFSRQLIDYSVREQLSDFVPNLLLAGAVGLGIYSLESWLSWPELWDVFVLGSAGVLVYLFGAKVLKLPALELAGHLMRQRMKGKTV